jgi:cell wall-associated NlpC family hydrolase
MLARGFQEVLCYDIERHDVILTRTGTRAAGHAAIYVGDNLILHHLTDQLSARCDYDDYWRRATITCLRHESRIRP